MTGRTPGRLERPCLKVTVLGNSVAVWVAPQRQDRSDATYAEHLEAQLAARGTTSRVTSLAHWNEVLPKAICRYDDAVRAEAPDIVILQYGTVEAFPAAVPIAVHQYLHTWHMHAGFGRTRLRNVLRRIFWKRLRSWQTTAARVLGQRTYHVGPRRFEAELRRFLKQVHDDQRALTVVVGIPAPNAELCALVPGLERRMARFNDIMRRVCDEAADGSATFVDLELLPEGQVPDGLHLSPAAHADVGARLADLVHRWQLAQSGANYARPVVP